MFGFNLSDTRTRTSHLNSSQPHSLHSAAESDPEPATTLSGIRPGQALFDDRTTPSPTAEQPASPKGSIRRYSLRTARFLTEKGAALKEAISTSKERARNQKTPSRKSSAGSLTSNARSLKSTTTRNASESESGRPGNGHDSSIGSTHSQRRDGAIHRNIHKAYNSVFRRGSADQVLQVPDNAGQDSDLGRAEGPSNGGDAHRNSIDRPGQHSSGPTQLPADFWDFPVDNGRLANAIAGLSDANPEHLSQLPREDLERMLERLVDNLPKSRPTRGPSTSQQIYGKGSRSMPQGPRSQGKLGSQTTQGLQAQAPSVPNSSWQSGSNSRHLLAGQAYTVQPPRNKVETQLIGSIKVGGGHHLDHPRTTNRPRKLFNPDTDSRTESETEPEPETQTENENETELRSNPEHTYPINQPIVKPLRLARILQADPTNPPSNSPSPLPSAHQPINLQSRSTLNLPFGSNLQDPPEPTRNSTRVRSGSIRRWESTSSISLGQPWADIVQPSTSCQPQRPSQSASKNLAGPSRPRGTAGQESSRARRASRPTLEPRQPEPKRTPAATQSSRLAQVRNRLQLQLERKRRARDRHDFDRARLPFPPDLLEDDEEARAAAAARASNCDPKSKKPAARDVHGNERFILTVAKPHLFMYTVAEGAWQTRALVTSWAQAIFQITWEEELPELPPEAPSARTIQCMVNSQPTFRGKSKDALRPFAEFYWGFKKPASTPEAIAHNIALADKLLPNNFHCVSFDPPSGHYESEALKIAIAIVLFANPTAVGVVFPRYVKPVPYTAVAYVLANMQFTIEEYATGKFQARDLKASDMLNKYVAHLRGLRNASRTAKGRFARLAEEWFEFGFEYSGAVQTADPFTQAVTLASDIRPDTPTPELSEYDYLPEPEDDGVSDPDEAGRYRKRAKGKVCA
ncbi:hypothetical protein RhiLY_06067 [Ceratobasidium sp. AG-Ba]|nr:hypothetical protein RhiLY_06067 [Ceratobasidium sp. AG-Ba]